MPLPHKKDTHPKKPQEPQYGVSFAADKDAIGDEEIDAAFSKAEAEGNANRYYYGLGRRKTSVAQVRLYTKGTHKNITVNDKEYHEYFPTPRLASEVEKPLKVMKVLGKFAASIKVSGGGPAGQAGAVRLGISRALVEFNAEFRKRLRRQGMLTRDPRMVERKKYGLKKARKAPQWAKR